MEEYDFELNKENFLKNFFDVLKIRSISGDELELSAYVKNELEKLGLKVLIDDCGKKFGGNTGNIIAKYIPKTLKNNPPVFLNAHLDTVKYNDENCITPEIVKGKIINRNKNCILGADDKAAVCAILEALKFLIKNNVQSGIIYIIFSVGEELALFGSRYIDMSSIDAEYGFVFDSEGDIGTIINKAPFHNRINIKVKGKASHAGVSPEKGINSIKSAAMAISNINSGRLDEETTCNIGVIKGGVETNIVPEITEVKSEVRSINVHKLDKVTNELICEFKKASEIFQTKLEYEILREYNGYEIKEDAMPVKIAGYAIKKLGITPCIRSTGGGSDTNNFNSKGKQAVNLSSGIENCHSNEEFIKVEELAKLIKLIIEICRFNKEEI
ncbi:M20/M25/M40 family metallo-hydrolase [bacterium]|nr:M20/M25/M40 family metallo-hydrolase [bacterium]